MNYSPADPKEPHGKVNDLATFQINNTDLSRDDMARLAGLTANVLDVHGNTVFKRSLVMKPLPPVHSLGGLSKR